MNPFSNLLSMRSWRFALFLLVLLPSNNLPGADTASSVKGSTLPFFSLETKDPIVADRKVPLLLRRKLGISSNTFEAMVRIHGATSQAYPKKSLAFSLKEPVALLPERKGADWVLNAAYIDRSLMRHKLSYDLFKSLSAPGAPRHAASSDFCEIELNGQYQGVYLLMERIDAALLGWPAFQSNDSTHAVIYKAIDHAANFHQGGRGGFEQRLPDPLTKVYWSPLEELTGFIAKASEPDFFSKTNGIASRLDLDNAIDFHLLVLLTSNLDGITKNFLIARSQPSPEKPQRFFFMPWDYDATFGRNWNADRAGPDAWLSNHLFDRLLRNADYRARWEKRWTQLRSAQFSRESIVRMIDQNAARLGEAASRNAAKWPTAGGWYPDALTFEQDLAQMKKWIEERLIWLDHEIPHR